MEWIYHLLIVMSVASLLQAATVNILPTNHSLSDSAHYTLQGYINHKKMNNSYNTRVYNNSELLLLPGVHILQTDFIVQNVYNFIMHGNNSKIHCDKAFLGISFISVASVILKNIEITNCGKNHIIQLSDNREVLNCFTAIYFDRCTDVNLSVISITVHSGSNGISAININGSKRKKLSVFQSITITGNCTKASPPSAGLMIRYHDYFGAKPEYSTINLIDYKYKNNGLCKNSFALNITTNQTQFNVSIEIYNTYFKYLYNSGVLNYHGESCGGPYRSILAFKNCSIEHNQGDEYLKLFHIVISNNGYIFSSSRENVDTCDKQINIINFRGCSFANNSDMKAILHILLLNSISANVLIDIRNSIFVNNENTEIIKIKSKVKILFKLTHYMILENINISSNSFDQSLISSANGLIKFLKSVIIWNNTYSSILQLYFSVIKFQGYSEFSSNNATVIIKATGGSYCIVKEYSRINITKNYVYSVMYVAAIWNDEARPLCFLQFISNNSNKNNLEEHNSKNHSLNYQVEFTDNVYFAPRYLVQQSTLFYNNCTWLKDTAFPSTNSSVVFSKVVKINIIYANRTLNTVYKLTICPCFNSSTYNCSQRYIGTVSPGQTLTVKLRLTTFQPFKTTFISSFSGTENISEACHLLDAVEIEQEHQSQQCNEHNYTIWSEMSECELYLSTDQGVTETLYVKLRGCPAGFILHRQKRICSCNPTLYPYITSCDLNDETILRLANSWISAYQVDQKYEYKISKPCPYKYCLPHSSHLNLSMPDSQCQFHRTGLLCGKCQQGLSAIFGSSQCKRCSNFYLFIIIPIAIAGVVLVMMLFIFNLTVTSGIINTFIFYINIISINYSTFFPECHSIDCLLLSLSNLDLGFETCFYNGMDGYFKALLQLVFPFYLIFIAFVLIIGSRHSETIQRITSHRALHVLATIFLLSYTKFLLTVCQVLFFYSEVIHLPSKHITLVWSLDVSVPLFGIKFLIAFLICLVIFIILLHFNILLLFARQLLRFKYINTFKPLLDAYFGPYKDQFFYWTGLQLTLRAVFFGLSAFHRTVSLTGGIIVLGFLLCFQGLMCPFKSRYKNIQEALVILNLQAVYALALYGDDDSNANVIIMQVLILQVLGYFFAAVSYHCLMSTSACRRVILRIRNKLLLRFDMLKDKTFISRSTHNTINPKDVNNRISKNYHELQESLIVLDN